MLKLNNIEVLYHNVIQVLRGVSLHVTEGQIVTILGGNGAGKTTILKSVSGLLRTEEGESAMGTLSSWAPESTGNRRRRSRNWGLSRFWREDVCWSI